MNTASNTDNPIVDTIFEDKEFVKWWTSEGGKTHSLDFIDVAVIRVAHKAYLYGLSRSN